MRHKVLIVCVGLMAGVLQASDIEPTWESMAEHYQAPDWFQDGKLGVWMCYR